MIKIDSNREFKLVRNSFSISKKINLKEIGFVQIIGSNLYIYQSKEYNILNYSIKPQLIFSIDSQEDCIFIKLQKISIKNLPFIFEKIKLTIEVDIFPEKDFCKIKRHISLSYGSKNKLIKYLSKNLMELISIRFDKKLIKNVLKVI